MFTAPITVTIDGTASDLALVSMSGDSAKYRGTNGVVELTNAQSAQKAKTRTMSSLASKKITSDLTNPALQRVVPFRTYIVAEAPSSGIVPLDDQVDLGKALFAWLATGDNFRRLLVGEK